MKKLLYLLSILLLPVFGVSQENLTEEPVEHENTNFKNQLDFEIELLGASISYKRKVSKSLFIGYGYGGGAMFNGNGKDVYLKRIEHKLFLNYQGEKGFSFYQGVSYSSIFYSTADDNSGIAVGIDFGFFYKGKIAEVGIKPSILFFSEGDWRLTASSKLRDEFEFRGVVTSLLVLKIPLSEW